MRWIRFRFGWRFWRRITQLSFLLLLLYLFRTTEFDGVTPIGHERSLFFLIDPLVAACAMLGSGGVIALLLPALIVVALTAVFGRAFCGWVCPMGTTLDLARKVLPCRFQRRFGVRLRAVKYVLLAIVLFGATMGLPLVGYVDPFAILVRALAVDIDPLFARAVSAPFDWLYMNASPAVTDVSEPVYDALKRTVLPFEAGVFVVTGVSAGLLLIIIALELVERRFFCRNLCPLGALLSVVARIAPLRRHPGRACPGCMSCRDICRMGAIDDDGRISPESCNLCMDCVDDCKHRIAVFRFKRPQAEPAPVALSRRGFVGAMAAGVALPLTWRALGNHNTPDDLLRPPGAAGERAFLDQCVRCGECLKVCPTHALQPSLLEAGVTGIFTPRLAPRIGYCEYNCVLCGNVCPTGAIPQLTEEAKHETVIGLARFDEGRCLPYAEAEPCLVCEEHCPVPDKAIRLRREQRENPAGEKVELDIPYIDEDRCIGCGICENKCPLEGAAGVWVLRRDIAQR